MEHSNILGFAFTIKDSYMARPGAIYESRSLRYARPAIKGAGQYVDISHNRNYANYSLIGCTNDTKISNESQSFL